MCVCVSGISKLIHLFSLRLGMIEEEREEDERKLNVAMAAADRIHVLVREKGI